ncbi:hypothetical protein M440DRAFT_1403745 [Trichoderma longibrachiatum ATCC 18648]|uniref:Mid2 domain-containing protein n=1 Tax=Trichoderma longibrachiatum ATCC 18648 TaxID=983965 RepID=A0A2T4BYL1_TRILO|nr:hypothetical protein M440DRAFT_1403745 [Trichoderma longibrachiatum ATCC 18648]
MRASNLLSTLAAVAVLATPVLAQNNKGGDNNNNKPASTTTSDNKPTPSKTTSTSSAGRITGTGEPDDDSGPTGLPTLTRGGAIPTYPPPTVPPTKNAPFMQHSNAPDGTVFIAVGAILGAFGLGVLLWRIIVSFLLHRSVRRAALAQHEANSKTGFPAPPAPFYKYSDQASPAAAPAGGGQQGPSISLTNLRPDSMSYPNGSRGSLMGPSPPDSPHFSPRRDMSSSSVNLNNSRQPGQRAPSAYLEDLLADEPGSLPPPQMPPSSGPRGSGSPRQRY